jgi:hypothetical protein
MRHYRSEIQKIKFTKARGIKFSICQFMVSWGFKIRESRKSLVSPKKKPPWFVTYGRQNI